jgi:tetratricopeptide (TPR) repeat protein
MRGYTVLIIFCLATTFTFKTAAQDSAKVAEKYLQSRSLTYEDPDRAMDLGFQALEAAKALNIPFLEAKILNQIGIFYYIRAEYDRSLDYYLQSEQIFTRLKDRKAIANAHNNIALIHAAPDPGRIYPCCSNFWKVQSCPR